MVDWMVGAFRWYRRGVTILMLIIVSYLSYDFYKGVQDTNSIHQYWIKDVNVVPVVSVLIALIGANVLLMFLFSPRGSTLWLTVFSLLWNGYVWFQVIFIPRLNEEIQQVGMNAWFKWSLIITGGLILSCFVLEWKSRYRMGWEFY